MAIQRRRALTPASQQEQPKAEQQREQPKAEQPKHEQQPKAEQQREQPSGSGRGPQFPSEPDGSNQSGRLFEQHPNQGVAPVMLNIARSVFEAQMIALLESVQESFGLSDDGRDQLLTDFTDKWISEG